MSRNMVVAALLLVLLSGATANGDENFRDAYEQVKIAVLYAGEESRRVADDVRGKLNDTGFDAEMQSSELSVDARDFLESNAEIDYALIILAPLSGAQFQAKVYTRGEQSPKILFGEDTQLGADIRTYLRSDPVRDKRIEIAVQVDPDSTEDTDEKYSALLAHGTQLADRQHCTVEELRQAIGYFEGAKKLKPTKPDPYLNLALAYSKLGDYERSKALIAMGLIKDRENPALKNQQAVLLMRDGQFDEAVKILEKISYNDPKIKWNLAYALFRLGKDDEAKETLGFISQAEASERIRENVKALQEKIKDKEDELHEQRTALARQSQRNKTAVRSLWIALIGLGVVASIGVIILIIRGTARRISRESLKPEDRLALQVQIGVTAISGAFTILSLMLGSLLR